MKRCGYQPYFIHRKLKLSSLGRGRGYPEGGFPPTQDGQLGKLTRQVVKTIFLLLIEEAEAEFRVQLQEDIEELEKQRKVIQQKLEELKDPTKRAWEDLKSGMDNAISEMENAFKKATERFQKEDTAKNQ